VKAQKVSKFNFVVEEIFFALKDFLKKSSPKNKR
jgi:hypothetical protein